MNIAIGNALFCPANEQLLPSYYFSTIIRDKRGKSALQWIEKVTMTYARQYLNDSTTSIKPIIRIVSRGIVGKICVKWILTYLMTEFFANFAQAIHDRGMSRG